MSDTADPTINDAPVPVRPTAVDGLGTERIVGRPAEPWTPAQVDPTDDEVARMAEHNARAAARREERLGALTDTAAVGETAQPAIDAADARQDELDDALDAQDRDDVTPVDPTTPDPTSDPENPADPADPDAPPVPETPAPTTPETPVEPTPSYPTTPAETDGRPF